jgi:hypothetical protein
LTRSEHVEWAKKRALEYVDRGDLVQAVASMASDLGKHPETRNHPGVLLTFTLHQPLRADEVRRYIEGFA